MPRKTRAKKRTAKDEAADQKVLAEVLDNHTRPQRLWDAALRLIAELRTEGHVLTGNDLLMLSDNFEQLASRASPKKMKRARVG